MRPARQSETLSRWCSALLSLALGVAFVWGAWRQTSGFDVWTFEGRRQMQIAAGELRASGVTLRQADGSVTPAPWQADSAAPAAYLVDFIYTRCPGVCRALGSEYQQLQRQLIARGHHDPAYRGVQLLSVSFDVVHDGVPQLQQAAAQWGAQVEQWRFAVPASEPESRSLLRSLGVVAIPDGAGGFVHNGDIHLLDRRGRLRGLFAFDDWPRALAAARELTAR
ncbi:MAG: SCO family protein [Rubrivivax sp.]